MRVVVAASSRRIRVDLPFFESSRENISSGRAGALRRRVTRHTTTTEATTTRASRA